MEFSLFIFVGAFIGIVFIILGVWQNSIARSERIQTVSELQAAHQTGSHRALTQYPQIQPYLCIGCESCVKACPEDNVIGLVDGIAQIIHGARCIGHGRCAEVCPVGAISVGLGNIATRPDIPILSKTLETTVPGIYIAGELGGISLIRNAIEHGANVVDQIAEKLKLCAQTQQGDGYDVLIIGSGPAGLSASLKCVQHKLKYKVIDEQDDIGGTIRKYPRRKLTLVQSAEIPLYGTLKGREYEKEELVKIWEEIFTKHKINASLGTKLTALGKAGAIFEAQTNKGTIRSRYVVLAIGRRGSPRKLGVPGEDSAKVMYQVLDAASYNNQHILVVGGGDSAIESATAFANQSGNRVTLSYRKPDFFRLKSRNEARIKDYAASKKVNVLFSSEVVQIQPGSIVLSVNKEEEKDQRISLPNHYVFVLAGSEPPYPLLKEAGIQFGGARL